MVFKSLISSTNGSFVVIAAIQCKINAIDKGMQNANYAQQLHFKTFFVGEKCSFYNQVSRVDDLGITR